MPEKRSEKSKYDSKYGGGFVTAAQFIAELLCERIAKRDKRDLPVRFWNMPAWKKQFMQQVLAANSFLKLYHPKAILTALRRVPNAFSLRAPFLDPILKEEQAKLDTFVENISPSPAKEIASTDSKPRDNFIQKKSTLNKLREID